MSVTTFGNAGSQITQPTLGHGAYPTAEGLGNVSGLGRVPNTPLGTELFEIRGPPPIAPQFRFHENVDTTPYSEGQTPSYHWGLHNGRGGERTHPQAPRPVQAFAHPSYTGGIESGKHDPRLLKEVGADGHLRYRRLGLDGTTTTATLGEEGLHGELVGTQDYTGHTGADSFFQRVSRSDAWMGPGLREGLHGHIDNYAQSAYFEGQFLSAPAIREPVNGSIN